MKAAQMNRVFKCSVCSELKVDCVISTSAPSGTFEQSFQHTLGYSSSFLSLLALPL